MARQRDVGIHFPAPTPARKKGVDRGVVGEWVHSPAPTPGRWMSLVGIGVSAAQLFLIEFLEGEWILV